MREVRLAPVPAAALPPAATAAIVAPADLAADLAAALLAAADADADALADRLHDGVLQALVVARYAADLAVRGGDPQPVRAAVQEALVALRREVWLLRPRADAGLGAALEALSAQRAASGGAPLDVDLGLDVHADSDPSPGALSPAGAALAYRFVQAAALPPGPVRVRLSLVGGDVVLAVTGAAPVSAAWDARARALGGRVELLPPGRTARLILPVRVTSDPEGAR